MKQSHGLVNHSSRIFFLAVVAIGATLFALRSIALARGVHAWSLSTANHNQRNRIQTPVIQNQGLISCSYWTRQRSIVLSGVAREKMDGVSINVGGGVGEWDPVAQIYIGGKVPEDGSAVQEMIDRNGGYLRIFGYGSLCWNPGAPGESALAHPSVTNTTGKALGYRRVWAQKSTDHRGSPKFPGIVCTLITEKEYRDVVTPESKPDCVHDDVDDSLTEGLIYTVPPEFVDVCLDELDFREKGVSTEPTNALGVFPLILNFVASADRYLYLNFRLTLSHPLFLPLGVCPRSH